MSKKSPALTRPNYSKEELAKGDIPFASLKNHELHYLFCVARKALNIENCSIVDRLFSEISMRLRGKTDTDRIDLEIMHHIRALPTFSRKFKIGDLVEVKREFRYGDLFTSSDIWRSGVVVGYGDSERSNEYKIDYDDAVDTGWTALEYNMRLAVNPSID